MPVCVTLSSTFLPSFHLFCYAICLVTFTVTIIIFVIFILQSMMIVSTNCKLPKHRPNKVYDCNCMQ